uniref:Uncharacterized protein n=1 Tax=Oryza meridionalis TaxID=40149 RepID=A0A0E0EEW0_9ORYZ
MVSSGEETTTAASAAAAVEVEVTRIENAIDPDVARLLEESGEPAVAGSESESEDDDLEEDFVLVANQDDDDFVLVEIENQFEEEENVAAVDDAEEDGLKNEPLLSKNRRKVMTQPFAALRRM